MLLSVRYMRRTRCWKLQPLMCQSDRRSPSETSKSFTTRKYFRLHQWINYPLNCQNSDQDLVSALLHSSFISRIVYMKEFIYFYIFLRLHKLKQFSRQFDTLNLVLILCPSRETILTHLSKPFKYLKQQNLCSEMWKKIVFQIDAIVGERWAWLVPNHLWRSCYNPKIFLWSTDTDKVRCQPPRRKQIFSRKKNDEYHITKARCIQPSPADMVHGEL